MEKIKQLAFIFFTLFTLATLNSCKAGRFIVYNFADINDYKKFPARNIENGATTFQFPNAEKGKVPREITAKDKTYPFEEYLDKNNTVAFLIIQHDTIQYENYWGKHTETSIVPSFSMAKSITSILIGCAIDDKLIQSVSEPITNYIPELTENGFDKVTIEHLLQMTSGLKFNENYSNPFGDAATFYYGTNLQKAISKMKLKAEPGKQFEYVSGNTQLLGLVLERALNGKTISAYLEEKIWKPLEMEFDASWSIDRNKNGLEKAFCCLNARARDFAKIGRLYLNKGSWNGRQVVSEDWVKQSTKVDTTGGSVWYYQYQWWLPTQTGDFMAQGILGQYIYIHPEKDLIIVRLGKNDGKTDWWEVFTSLGRAY
jgi:CubicO group peptidase (beta-lactamase class C family)